MEKGKWKEIFKGEKGKKILVICLVAAISLLFLSEFWPQKQETVPAEELQSMDEYTETMEKRVKAMLESIAGVGSCKVMVTFEGTAEYVYATEVRQSSDKSETVNGENTERQDRNELEESYILIEEEGGNKALVKTTREPKISGVVVACEGGGNVVVQQRVVNAVTVALGISSNQVYVAEKID